MKKIVVTTLLSLLVLSPVSAIAEVEDWYTYWAIGPADHNYGGELDSVMGAADSIPGIDRTEIGLDMFGFYWPYDNTTMMGFVISGSYDRLEDNFGDYMQLNQYLYGFSTMHFFGSEIGDGFYVRGDVGIAKMVLDSSFGATIGSDTGTGFLLGVGYAWPVSAQSRVMLGMGLSRKNIEGDTVSSTVLTIGGLW